MTVCSSVFVVYERQPF